MRIAGPYHGRLPETGALDTPYARWADSLLPWDEDFSMRFVIVRRAATLVTSAGLLSAAACAHSGQSSAGGAPAPAASMATTPPSPDPRVGLKAGLWDAGQAAWNVRLVSTNRPSEKFLTSAQGTNSDL